jgi:chaperonin cofactor prefoldin
LEGTVSELKKTNADLLDENGWIVVCKTEQEEKLKKLEMENESLATRYTILSNQRQEIEACLHRFLH